MVQLRLSIGVRQNERCRINRDATAEKNRPGQRSETKTKKKAICWALKHCAEFQHNLTIPSLILQNWHIHGSRLTLYVFFCSQYLSATPVTKQGWRIKDDILIHCVPLPLYTWKFRTWKANNQLHLRRLQDKMGLAVHPKWRSMGEDG